VTGAAPLDRRDDSAALIARAVASAASAVARRVLVLRLSCLPAAFARPHHLRLARDALDPLRTADRAETFELPNADIAILWRGPGDSALQASLRAIAELFAGTREPAPDPATLCVILDLPQQVEALLRLVEDSRSGVPDATAAPEGIAPLDPARLAALEAVLARADLARFVRRHPVVRIGAHGEFRPAWERWVISVTELGAELAPGCAIRAEPWLFRRLSRTLDARLLALLAAPGELRSAGPFGIDLNVASILGPEFLRFDAVLPAAMRRQVVLGLTPADILADIPTFLFARDFAKTRGYQLLLHVVGVDLLVVLPPDPLGFDLVQFPWSAAMATADPDFAGLDPQRLILGDATCAQALAWGRLRGIRLFQGRVAKRQVADRAIARHRFGAQTARSGYTREELLSVP
jgi:hypothetical protein